MTPGRIVLSIWWLLIKLTVVWFLVRSDVPQFTYQNF